MIVHVKIYLFLLHRPSFNSNVIGALQLKLVSMEIWMAIKWADNLNH